MGLTKWQRLFKIELPMAKHDHHRGRQPDHDGRAVDGHDRGLHQRSRPRPARRTRPERAARGRRLRARPVHRADGDHARPGHDGRQPELRAAGPRRGQDGRPEPGHVSAAAAIGTAVIVYLSRTVDFFARPPAGKLGDWISERRAERDRLDLDPLGDGHLQHRGRLHQRRSSTSWSTSSPAPRGSSPGWPSWRSPCSSAAGAQESPRSSASRASAGSACGTTRW